MMVSEGTHKYARVCVVWAFLAGQFPFVLLLGSLLAVILRQYQRIAFHEICNYNFFCMG